jgi:hypothetical protein
MGSFVARRLAFEYFNHKRDSILRRPNAFVSLLFSSLCINSTQAKDEQIKIEISFFSAVNKEYL